MPPTERVRPRALYNEIDDFAVPWLRNLVTNNHIAPGRVDARSIEVLQADDVARAVQFHAFAGIGAWSYALRLAGWPDDRPVWTGSCPCQPFSLGGRGRGFDDERHLWPAWFRLINECRPPIIFGEQVEGPLGRAWLDAVFADLEGADYACGAAVLPAAGVGAPHGRHRIFWVAHTVQTGRAERRAVPGSGQTPGGGGVSWVAHHHQGGLEGRREPAGADRDASSGALAQGRGAVGGTPPATPWGYVGVADARLQQRERRHGAPAGGSGDARDVAAPRRGDSPWDDVEWLPCSDGKVRPTQPGLFPLAHGATTRVGRLCGYGNAIVPQVAAEFIAAYLEVEHAAD